MVAHLADQAKKRHEDYLKAEIATLREDLRKSEEKIAVVLRRLNTLERNLGWPGN